MKKQNIFAVMLSCFIMVVVVCFNGCGGGGGGGSTVGGTTTVTPLPAAICGNGSIETGEQCDDGNKTSGDGCSSTCQKETYPGKITGYIIDERVSDQSGITVIAESITSTGRTSTIERIMEELNTGRNLNKTSIERTAEANIKTAITDKEGKFEVINLPVSAYVLYAIKSLNVQNPTYGDIIEHPEKYSSSDLKLSVPTKIEITTEQPIQTIGAKDINTNQITPGLTVEKTSIIQGTAKLSGETNHSNILCSIPGTSFAATTDSNGAYTMRNIPVGTFVVACSKTNYEDGMKAGITVTAGKTTIVPEITLKSPTLCSLSIKSITTNPTTVYTGATSTIYVETQSSNCGSLIYSYTNEGTITGTGSPVTWTAPSKVGIYTIYVTVNDGIKYTTSQTSVMVQKKACPTLVLDTLSVNPQEISIGASSTISASPTYTGNGNLTYTWTKSEGTIVGTGNSVKWISPDKTGVYSVYLAISESICNQSYNGMVNIIVKSSPIQPLSASISASKPSVNSSDTITLTATSNNPNSGTLSYTWLADGGSLSSTSGALSTWTAPSTAGVYNISLTASDGKGGSGKTTISISVSVTTLPLTPSITANKISINTGESIILTATSNNPNSGTLSYTWLADGGSLSSTSGALSTWTAPTTAGVYNISLTASDGKGGTGKTTISIAVIPPTPEVATVQYKDKTISAYDSSNNKLWDYTVTSNIIEPLVADVDGNGSNEVVFGTDRDGSDKGVIYVLNKIGNKMWSYKPSSTGVYWSDDQFMVNEILVDDVDGDGKKEVISVSTPYYYYASRISIISDTGQLQGSYWNPGNLLSLELDDIDNDNKKEIISGGWNNDIGKSVVFALDGEKVIGELEAPPDKGNATGGLDKQKWYTDLPLSESEFGGIIFLTYVVTESDVKKIIVENQGAGFIFYLGTDGKIISSTIPGVTVSVSPTSVMLSGGQAQTTLTCATTGPVNVLEGRCHTFNDWEKIEFGNTKTCIYASTGTYTPGCRVNMIISDDTDTAVTVKQNQSPTITSTAVTSAFVGMAYSYDINATDADGDTIAYSLTTNPTGMTINSTTGIINWMPTASGSYNVTVSVSDGKEGTVKQSWTILVFYSSWAKIFGGSEGDWANSIQQTSEGGYIVDSR